MKKVTVVMSTYKTNNTYLREAIDSILAQTYKKIEFIIIVDGDLDNLKCVEEYRDERIVILYNETNRGLPYSLNRALEVATGEYIARMDADDVSLPKRISRQVEYLDKHLEVDAVGTFSQKFGYCNKKNVSPYTEPEDIASELSFRCILDHPTMMFRACFIKENNLKYNTDYFAAQDYELWSRMIKIGKIAIAPFIGLKIRTHDGQISSTKKQLQTKNAKKIIKSNCLFYNIEGIDKNRLIKSLTVLNSVNNIEKKEYKRIINVIKQIKKEHPKLAGHMLVRVCNICLKNKAIKCEMISVAYLEYIIKLIATRIRLFFPYRVPNKKNSVLKKALIKILLKLDEIRIITLKDTLFLKLKYSIKTGNDIPDLEYPTTFNEKIQWLKLHDRKKIYTTMVDKYEAKKYVSKIIGKEYIVPTLGVYNKFDEIDFAKLPNRFVIKCTHDSGGLIVVGDKDKLDIEMARTKINNLLDKNFYYPGREWPYKNVKPRIIIEKYLVDDEDKELRDYKLFCFNGKYKMMFIATNRQGEGETYFDFFDHDFRHLPFINGHPHAPVMPHSPSNLKTMIKLAERLSKNIPQVRVDFYEANGQIFFGEMTFYHFSGFTKFEPEEWDKRLGNLIDLGMA